MEDTLHYSLSTVPQVIAAMSALLAVFWIFRIQDIKNQLKTKEQDGDARPSGGQTVPVYVVRVALRTGDLLRLPHVRRRNTIVTTTVSTMAISIKSTASRCSGLTEAGSQDIIQPNRVNHLSIN